MHWLFSSGWNWLISPDSEWSFLPDANMFIILFIFIIGIPLIKEWVENENYRKQCHDRGMETYWANDGTYRYTDTNKRYKG